MNNNPNADDRSPLTKAEAEALWAQLDESLSQVAEASQAISAAGLGFVVHDDDHAYALLPVGALAKDWQLIEAEADSRGFELMPESECPAEVTDDGFVKVHAAIKGGVRTPPL